MSSDVRTHGVSFDGVHSYFDLGLWPGKGGFDKGTPSPKLSTVNVPGMDGILDMTEANTGSVKFGNRTMVLNFAAKVDLADQAAFEATVMDALHGRQINQIVFDDDPDWYYSGRVSVRFADKKPWKERVILTVDAAPYAMKGVETVQSLIPAAEDYEKQLVPYGTDDSVPTVYPGGVKLYENTGVNIDGGIEYDSEDECLVIRKLLKGTSVLPESRQYITVYGSTPSVGEAPAYKIYRPQWDIRQGSVDLGYMFDVYIPLADIANGTLPGGGSTGAVNASDITRVFVSGLYRCEVYAEDTVAKIVVRNNSRKSVIPTFVLDAQFAWTMTHNGKTYTVQNGENVFPDIALEPGENVFYIPTESADIVTTSFDIRFREGRL